MDILGSRVSGDEKVITSNLRCPACGKRVVNVAPNPRYVPVIHSEAPPPNKNRRQMKDEVLWKRPRCRECGDVMRDGTSDGLCYRCAEVRVA